MLLTNDLFVPSKGGECFINILPPELLSCIFEICRADRNHSLQGEGQMALEDGDKEADTRFFHTRNPLSTVLSLVCRNWRNVAILTASLWTTISVPRTARPPYAREAALLEWSKNLPIDVYINSKVPRYNRANEAISDVNLRVLFAMFISHVHRWHTIKISVSEYDHMYVFLNAASASSIPAASQLTTLQLYSHERLGEYHFEYPGMSKHFILFGGSAPSLTRVALWGVHVDWSQPWIASTPNLTDLTLAFHADEVRPSWAQFSAILRGASVLEKLELRQSGPSGDPAEWFVESGNSTDHNAPVPLSRVTYFTLVRFPEARTIALLRKLYLPAVKALVLELHSNNFVRELVGTMTSLAPFQQPYNLLSGLDSINLTGRPCHISFIEMLYSELRDLTTLHISVLYLSEWFLEVLGTPYTLNGRDNVWLPRLTTLHITEMNGTALREVVRRRRDLGVPLTSLYVNDWMRVEKTDEKWFKENLKTFKYST